MKRVFRVEFNGSPEQMDMVTEAALCALFQKSAAVPYEEADVTEVRPKASTSNIQQPTPNAQPGK